MSRTTTICIVRLVCVALAILLATRTSLGQVTPEEHAKHHPGPDQKPGAAPGGMTGGMEGMGEHGHGKAPPKELYPSLMAMPELTPQQRAEVERLAGERMTSGTALMGKGLDRLSEAAATDNLTAMQEAAAQVREGLAVLESGLAARRALAEGKLPRAVALEWFKREMNLSPSTGRPEAAGGPFGLSWFHFSVMVVLAGFAAAMLWMYYRKMNRAAELLKRLAGDAPAPAGGGAKP
jgi:hypothetical protein